MTSKLLLAALVPLALATAPLAAQSSINLPPSPDSARITGFGKPGFTTVGQSFKVPTGNATVLQNFQFFLGNDRDFGGNGGGLFFKGYVAAFDGMNITGPILFESIIKQGNPSDTFAPFNFNTGGLALNPGSSYVAFLSAAGIPSVGNVAFEDLEASDAPYTDGSFVFQNSGDDPASLTRDPFSSQEGVNAAFSAQFINATSTVPEPSEFVLLASGLSGLAGIVRLRRRRVAGA